MLIVAGALLMAVGLAITLGARLPFRLGHLPGDIAWQGRNASFYFPLTTCLLVSAVATLVMWILRRL